MTHNTRTRPRRHRRECVRVVADRCRGNVFVLSGECDYLAQELRARNRGEITARRLVPGGAQQLPAYCFEVPDGRFRTIVLDGVLQHMSREEGAQLVQRLCSEIPDRARLIVVVPNADAGRSSAGGQPYTRRRLRRLLKTIGRPRLVKEQPYRWLVFQVDRGDGSVRKLSRAVRERYRVTSGLCRGKVLELGCGKGNLTRAIHERGLDVTGVDLSSKQIRDARALHPHLTFLQSDARSLEFPDGSFDTVVLAEILEHVDDEVGVGILDEATRLLAPGGRLVASVPNEDCIPHRAHLREFTRRSLRRMLRPLGRPVLVKDQPFKWLTMYVDRDS